MNLLRLKIMNKSKYERLLEDLVSKTKNKELIWKVSTKEHLSKELSQGRDIIQVFRANYSTPDSSKFNIFAVKERIKDYSGVFDEFFYADKVSLLFFNNQMLLFDLAEYLSFRQIRNLLDNIEVLNDSSEKLFNQFK